MDVVYDSCTVRVNSILYLCTVCLPLTAGSPVVCNVSTDSSGDMVTSLVNTHFAKSLKMATVTFADILKKSSCLYTASSVTAFLNYQLMIHTKLS